ncbi:hypothetical protein NPIL_233211 [Nephila pilipes]|uniref:Uncharacterized protein n=1 Tax=Nephila pilipes TaxID=299642 RepID=A0A8X6PVU6_NEPPI|nr:hypothetical protein NPIL_233211 [Nephila pilipes]
MNSQFFYAAAASCHFIFPGFPIIHKSPLVTREVVNDLSLLYYVKGSDKSLKPYLLAGHLDVVPVEESFWEVPPFSGEIKDGFIWGRGSIDCKHVVMGLFPPAPLWESWCFPKFLIFIIHSCNGRERKCKFNSPTP